MGGGKFVARKQTNNEMVMKNSIHTFVMALVLLVAACSNANQKKVEAEVKPELPAGAIEMRYERHIYCDVMLRDSIHARMIFDTGCTNLLLDSTFYAERFAADGNLRRAMLGGAGGGMELANIDASKWSYRIGEEAMTENMAIVLNLRKIVGNEADGMFGMMFMKGKRVEINYANSYMRFLAAEEKIGDDYTRIPFTWDGQRMVLPLSITMSDGYVFDGRFLVDTGMSGTLSLNSPTANRLESAKYLADARTMSYLVGGIGGGRKDYLFKTPQIALGGHAIKDVMITWSSNKEGSSASNNYDGLIGNELLERFDVIFDFAGSAVYLRPNKNFDRPEPNFLGVALTPMADHWIVNGLLEGGNAEKAGLRQGDRIEKINGMTANDPKTRTLNPLPDKLTLSVLRNNNLIEIVVNKE